MSVKSENVIIKKIENKIDNFSILSGNINNRIGEKRYMSYVVDEILISRLQDFEQHHKLIPINIKIDNSQIISSLWKYRKYRPKITSLLVSTSFNQTTDAIFINCNELNDTKKALINGKTNSTLGVVNLTEETNFDLIKNSSKWLNILFCIKREAKHFSFEVISESLQDILSFSYFMLDSKGSLLALPAYENRVPVWRFTIQAIRWC